MSTPADDRRPDEAINAVLEAERNAQLSVARCRSEAEAMVEAARAEVRRINARRDSRLAALVARCEHITELQLAHAAQDERALAQALPGDGPYLPLAEAVERAAARLTGGSVSPAADSAPATAAGEPASAAA